MNIYHTGIFFLFGQRRFIKSRQNPKPKGQYIRPKARVKFNTVFLNIQTSNPKHALDKS